MSFLRTLPIALERASDFKGESKVEHLHPTLPMTLKTEIETFPPSRLLKTMVYYVNTAASEQFPIMHWAYLKVAPRIHGFLAVGKPGTKQSAGSARVYTPRRARLQESFCVSPKFVPKAMSSTILSSTIKSCLTQIQGESFLTGELLLRKVFTLKALKEGLDVNDPLVQNTILINACNKNAPEAQFLLRLFTTSLNVEMRSSSFTNKLFDQEIVEKNLGITVKAYPNIHPLAVRDVYAQQELATRYLTEKVGQGESTSIEDKKIVAKRLAAQPAAPLTSSFAFLPSSHNLFETNCNKMAASFLQSAEALSAIAQLRRAEVITGASYLAFGDSQRMFIWNPLVPSLKASILKIINGTRLDQLGIPNHDFTNNKPSILSIIFSLPLLLQRTALQQVLDKRTPLGQVFYVRTRCCLFNRPSRNRELMKAQARLLEVENYIKKGTDLGIERQSLS